MTMDGTVTEILGYLTLFFKRDARSPDASAPIKAAAAGGKDARSTSSRRRVLQIAPSTAAEHASFTGLLNMMEKPNTPKKLAISRSRIHIATGI